MKKKDKKNKEKSIKSLNLRKEEVENIRKQLQNIGVFVVDENKEIFEFHVHAFLSMDLNHVQGSTFSLKIPENNIKFDVILSLRPINKSGILSIQ